MIELEYTNSPLVSYTKLSPSNSGQRKHAIDTITPHCVVGQATVEGLGDYFYPAANQVSSNYGIGCDGRVGMYVEEKNRSWCSSSADNDNRAITIECASDTKEPYAFRDAVYDTLIRLGTDICQRYGKKKLLWLNDKAKTLAYQPAEDEMVLTVHRWFYAQKSCPGTWMMNHMDDLAQKVTAALNEAHAIFAEEQEPAEEPEPTEEPITEKPVGLQGADLAKMCIDNALNILGPIFTREQKEHGLLASVMLAQLVTESGCNSELFRNANAAFSMKCMVSGNDWPGSVWDGKSKYKFTWEEWHDGKRYESIDFYRAYPDIEHSIEDHRAYLLNAKKEDGTLRYAGLAECTDAEKAIKIIVQGGYCTEPNYADALLYYLETYALGRWDVQQDEQPEKQDEQQTPTGPAGEPLFPAQQETEYKQIPIGDWNAIKYMIENAYQAVKKNDDVG